MSSILFITQLVHILLLILNVHFSRECDAAPCLFKVINILTTKHPFMYCLWFVEVKNHQITEKNQK